MKKIFSCILLAVIGIALLLVLTSCGAPSAKRDSDICVDIYEPNDSETTATVANVGGTYTGVLSSANDKDYFCVKANGHSSLSFTFVQDSHSKVQEIGWEISYYCRNDRDDNQSKASDMAWLNQKIVEGDFWEIDSSNGYFIVWVENTRYGDMDEIWDVISQTEYTITFHYID